MSDKGKPRQKARKFLMQALYQWGLLQEDVTTLTQQFKQANANHRVDWEFFDAILPAALDQVKTLDAQLEPLTTHDYVDANLVEVALLRLGAYELMHRIDVPYKVVIDEYVTLAQEFGAEEGYKFVNGVLDRLARDCRATEVSANGS